MKKTILTIIITLAVAVGVILLAHSIWGDGECIFSGDDDKTECTKEEKKECCDKEHEKKGCCDEKHGKESHGMLCDSFKPIRAEFDTQLNDEEKATIAGIKEKFADVDHTEMCPESHAKFMEEHKADFEALTAIADNHKEYFDEMIAKMEAKKKEECKHEEGEGHDHDGDDDGEVVKDKECPEASKCKDATEKCKGEKTAEAEKKCEEEEKKKCKEEEAKKCEEAEKKCEKECLNTFKIHFLLLDF